MNSIINNLDISGPFPYRYIFNPAVAKTAQNRYVMVCRMQNHSREGTLGLAYLDDNFQLEGQAEILSSAPTGNTNVMLEDPRIAMLNGQPYVAYVESSPVHLFTTYVVLAQLRGLELVKPIIIPYKRNHDAFVRLRKYDLHIADNTNEHPIPEIEGNGNTGVNMLPSREWIIEKNWQFFSMNDAAYCIYEANNKHVVFEFDPNNGAVKKEYITYYSSSWKTGNISGGASPVKHFDGNWYSFFHSWTDDDQKKRTYHTGVYLFEDKPPFRIKQISCKPLLSASDPHGSSPSGHAVIFPGSAVFDIVSNDWLIAAGYNDEKCVLLRISHSDVQASLVQVNTVNKFSRLARQQFRRFATAIKKRLSAFSIP